MRVLKNFKLKTLPSHRVVIALTDNEGYEETRFILATAGISSPEDYLVITGGHCSCYGFEETTWEATAYSVEELWKLMNSWVISNGLLDKEFSKLVLVYLRQKYYV